MALMLSVAVMAAVLIVAVFSILHTAERDKNAQRNDRLSGFGVLEQGTQAGGRGMLTSLGFRDPLSQIQEMRRSPQLSADR